MKIIKTAQFENAQQSMDDQQSGIRPSKTPFTPELDGTGDSPELTPNDSVAPASAQIHQPMTGQNVADELGDFTGDLKKDILNIVSATIQDHITMDNNGIGAFEMWGTQQTDQGSDVPTLNGYTVGIDVSAAPWLATDPEGEALEGTSGNAQIDVADSSVPLSWDAAPMGIVRRGNASYAIFRISENS